MEASFLSVAPLCPAPPDTPEEGVREYRPIAIGQEPERLCALNSEEIELRCHTFLSVYLQSVTYGRNSTMGKELCDGEKPKDKKAPALNCYDEDFNLNLLSELDYLCLGHFNCTFVIPTVPLDPVCDGLSREVRIEYLCGKISQQPAL